MAVTNDFEIANLALDLLGVTQKMASLTDTTREAQAANRWYALCRDLTARALPWRFNRRAESLILDGVAVATVTLTNGLAAGATVTINGVVLTATVTTNPTVGQWAIPTTPVSGAVNRETAAIGLVAAIAAHPSLSTTVEGHVHGSLATLSATVVHVHAKAVGPAGNLYTISSSSAGVATAAFDNGHDPDVTEWAYVYSLPPDFLMARRIQSGNRRERVNDRIAFDLQLSVQGEFVLLSDYTTTSGPMLEYTAQITDVTQFPDHFLNVLVYLLAEKLVMPLALRPELLRLAKEGQRLALAEAWVMERGGFQPDPSPDSEFIAVR